MPVQRPPDERDANVVGIVYDVYCRYGVWGHMGMFEIRGIENTVTHMDTLKMSIKGNWFEVDLDDTLSRTSTLPLAQCAHQAPHS